MTELKAGDIIAARYRVRAVRAGGGLVASSLRHGVDVVLTFQEGWTDGELGRQAFASGACRLIALRHDHLVTHLDHGWCERRGPFLVTEHIGTPLPARVVTLPIPVLGHIAAQLCAVLDGMHDAEVFHHGLSWRAVVVDPRPDDPWRVRLRDLGLIPPVAPGEAGILAGNPVTMAPEVVAGRPADGRADQYGLAVMIWEALEGRPPFEAADLYALLRLHVSAPLPPLEAGRDRARQVPGLEAILRRALAKDPADRHATMADFHAALCGVWGVTPRPRATWHPSAPRPAVPEARVVRERSPSGPAADATIRAAAGDRGRLPDEARPPPSGPLRSPAPAVDLGTADFPAVESLARVDAPRPELATLLEAAPVLPSQRLPLPPAAAAPAPASGPRGRNAWSRAPRWSRVALALGVACWLVAGLMTLVRS